ncbi:hypothetical protein WA026_003898 [Henosepilachna vigintioctopunctata]|uniref:Protein takeout-like n=1 Tax=Henosepilachna vigintioctopunctata TaxID=420089 RepID=A0AAW1U951_9CUCU
MMTLQILCILSILVTLVIASNLPNYIKPCPLRSPEFTKCAVKHGNEALPFLIKGDRKNGLPPFNPLKIPYIQIKSSGLEMNLTDCVFRGAEKLKLIDLSLNNSTKQASCKLTTPMLIFEFEYVVTGKIASLPIGGNGHGVMDIINSTYVYNFEYDIFEKNGQPYMKIGNDNLTIHPMKIETNLQNLFGGNKQLGDALNLFLNENWEEVLKEFSPTISHTFGAIARKLFETSIANVPLKEAFTDW